VVVAMLAVMADARLATHHHRIVFPCVYHRGSDTCDDGLPHPGSDVYGAALGALAFMAWYFVMLCAGLLLIERWKMRGRTIFEVDTFLRFYVSLTSVTGMVYYICYWDLWASFVRYANYGSLFCLPRVRDVGIIWGVGGVLQGLVASGF